MTDKHDDNLATPERLKRDKLIREALEKDPGEWVPMFATTPKAVPDPAKRMSAEMEEIVAWLRGKASKTKPTIAELETILSVQNTEQITMEPDGSISVGAKYEQAADLIASLSADLEAARGAALEEAVKAVASMPGADDDADYNEGYGDCRADAIEAIRALKEPT